MAQIADPPRTGVTQYAQDVMDGRILAGRLVRLAAERHLRDLDTGQERGLWFDDVAAEKAISFFELLRLAEGEFADKPFVLQPWQEFIVGSLFGWKGTDGHRRFRTAYIEMGKGNGKTPLAAAIGLYGLVGDDEPGAEIYPAAVTRDQANILFTDAKKMVAASPALSARIENLVRNLSYRDSFMRPVSSQARSLDGKRVHMALIDEVHEHPSALVVDKMRAGTKGRRQALILEITNAGYDRNSVCWHHHEYSRQVVEQPDLNDTWFAYVCGLDEGDDWADEAVWLKANPNLGVSVTLKYLREQVAEAKGMPSKQNIVRRLNFCEWTEQSTRWLDMDIWDLGAESFDQDELRGRMCYGGLDLAKSRDLSALILLFPPQAEGERWKVLCRFWVPEEDITRRSLKDGVPYEVWRDEGFIEATPGNSTDRRFINAAIVETMGRYDVREIAFDRVFFEGYSEELADEGVPMVPFGQGFLSMAGPTAELDRMLLAKEIQHGANPVLRWMASNVVVQQDAAGNMKPDKARSSEKIDGIVALVMCLGRAMVQKDAGPSVYDEDRPDGLLTL